MAVPRLYLSNFRDLILSSLAGQLGALIHGNDGWFHAEDPRAMVTGPNTIRLWEAIGSGAIPIILSDTFRPPGPRLLWDDALFFLPDNAQAVLAIPQLTKQCAADPELLAASGSASPPTPSSPLHEPLCNLMSGSARCWQSRGQSVKPRMHALMIQTYYQWIDFGLASLRSWQRTMRRFPRLSPIRFPSSIALVLPPLSAAAWSF